MGKLVQPSPGISKNGLCVKNYQNGPQHACSTYLFEHFEEISGFFVIARNLMMGTPRKGDSKVPFKTNNSFNSTMMASFLPVLVSKKNKQTKKNMSFIAV